MKIRIGAIEFPSKKKAREHVRSLFNKYALGQVVNEEDYEFLCALLNRHPEQESKEGCGVAYFTRSQHPDFKTPGFRLHRIDNSSTDFSTETCLDGKAPTLISEWRQACRTAVDARVHAHKNEIYDANNGQVECPETGESLEKGEYWLIQVAPTWSELVDDFLTTNGIEPSVGDITNSVDNQYGAAFKNADLVQRFRAFHESRMNLIPKKIA